MTRPPEVSCLDCGRPVKSAEARARRRGGKCERRRKAELRRQAAPAPLPAMPAVPRRPGAAQAEALITEDEVRTDG